MEKGGPADTYPDLRFTQWKVKQEFTYIFSLFRLAELTHATLVWKMVFPTWTGAHHNILLIIFYRWLMGGSRKTRSVRTYNNTAINLVIKGMPSSEMFHLHSHLLPFSLPFSISCTVLSIWRLLCSRFPLLLYCIACFHDVTGCVTTHDTSSFSMNQQKRPKAEEVSVMKGSGVCRKNIHVHLFSQDFLVWFSNRPRLSFMVKF